MTRAASCPPAPRPADAHRSGGARAHRPRHRCGARARRPPAGPGRRRLGLTGPEAGDGWLLLAARARRAVEVRGDGRVALALAGVLAAAGVGEVRAVGGRPVLPGDLAPGGAALDDVGGTAARALAAAGAGSAPAAASPARRPPISSCSSAWGSPTTWPHRSCWPTTSRTWRSSSANATSSWVPWSCPGDGPCLRCLDLHRADRDPAWPRVLAQLSWPARPRSRARRLALLAASLAALQVLLHLDGGAGPAPWARTLELELPRPVPRRACRWSVPACLAAGGARRLRPRPSAGALPRRQDDNGPVSDLPRKAVTRTAKLASLPLGFAGRTASGSASGSAASRPSWSPPRCRPAPPSSSSRCSASSRAGR